MSQSARSSFAALVSSALVLAAFGIGAPALAQKKDEAAKPAAAAADDAAKQSAWVKLCEKAAFPKKGEDGKIALDKDGKPLKDEKQICLTHHERLDGNTGMVLVSAAIREVEGQDKKSLMIMVPLGMAIPAGVRAAVYSTDQWDKASKNEKIDEASLKPVELKFSLCHPAGCTAEAEADAALVDSMKKGGGIMILALNAGAQPIGFPVPLNGFTAAIEGAPVDNEAYNKARAELMQKIRARQQQLAEKARAEEIAKKEALKLLDPPPGAKTEAVGEKKADKKAEKKKKE
ncbi:MAG: invasion associated locus B family protein [Hyphomicrobiaceae bacterium]